MCLSFFRFDQVTIGGAMEFPGERLVIKLWETLAEKGIGSLLSPWQINREGKVHNELRRAELLMLAQAEVDASEIRAGRKCFDQEGSLRLLSLPPIQSGQQLHPDGRIEPCIDIGQLVNASHRASISQAAREEINVSKAIIHAEETLSNDTQTPPERDIEEDWLFTWRDYAARVSTDELQQLWGKVLAGEVKSPGNYSLRTLEFMKGLSKSEAEKISNLAKFQIEGRIFRNVPDYIEAHGITFDLLLEMQGLGVVSGAEALALSTNWKSYAPDSYLRGLRSNGKILVVEHEDSTKVLNTEVCLLTTVGQQLLGLGSFDPDVEYLGLVGIEIAKQGFKVKLADWKQETEAMGNYYNGHEISV